MTKTVSFDLWDTILKRKCSPEEIKLKTCNYIRLNYYEYLRDNYKNIYKILELRNQIEFEEGRRKGLEGFDTEYTIETIFEVLLERIVIGLKKNIIKELVDYEISCEKESSYVNPDILPILKEYKDYDIYCISDFYMNSKQLSEILEDNGIANNFKKVYSSCDYFYNKKSGELYKIFAKENNIDLTNHIHFGDSYTADINPAKKLGIETHLVVNNSSNNLCKYNRSMHYNLKSLKVNEKKDYDRFYNAGVELAPLLYFFVYSIVENAIINKIDTVYYQTREGETFIKIHDLIKKNNVFNFDIPDAKVMEVSRMGTFGASLNEFSIDALMRIWTQYKEQSMKALFTTLNIDIKNYLDYFEEYDIDIEEKIKHPWKNEKIIKLFNNKKFTEDVEKEISIKRNNLLEYFDQTLNIKNDDKDLFVVDIGWRGTIQDNLCYIFNKKNIGGYYLTLFEYYNRQPKNSYKLSFIDDLNVRDKIVIHIITLLEWIFNPGTGSVIEYKDGKAVRKAKTKELDVVNNYIKPMQDGMFKGAELINDYIKYHSYEAEEMKNVVYDLLKNVKEKPSKAIIEAYYSMVFNDTFGTAEYITKNNKLTFAEKLNLLKCRDILRKEDWKESFMEYNNMHYMKLLVDAKGLARRIAKK